MMKSFLRPAAVFAIAALVLALTGCADSAAVAEMKLALAGKEKAELSEKVSVAKANVLEGQVRALSADKAKLQADLATANGKRGEAEAMAKAERGAKQRALDQAKTVAHAKVMASLGAKK